MQHSSLKGWAWFAAAKLRDLAILLFALSTPALLLLRAAGDPAQVMAGPEATPEALAAIRAEYGFDRPLHEQYGRYLFNLVTLDFGVSLASREPALGRGAEGAGPTILLTASGHGGNARDSPSHQAPGSGRGRMRPRGGGGRRSFRAAGCAWVRDHASAHSSLCRLALLLPSTGFSGRRAGSCRSRGWLRSSRRSSRGSWRRMGRRRMREDYVRTARAIGASEREVLWRHAVPNALLGAAALIGAQFAFLLGGSVVTESIFSWRGWAGICEIDAGRSIFRGAGHRCRDRRPGLRGHHADRSVIPAARSAAEDARRMSAAEAQAPRLARAGCPGSRASSSGPGRRSRLSWPWRLCCLRCCRRTTPSRSIWPAVQTRGRGGISSRHGPSRARSLVARDRGARLVDGLRADRDRHRSRIRHRAGADRGGARRNGRARSCGRRPIR